MKFRIPWIGLADQIEDARHTTMTVRRYLSKEDTERLATTPRILVDACNRAATDPDLQPTKAEKQELDLANYLIGQYEEALTFLGSMID